MSRWDYLHEYVSASQVKDPGTFQSLDTLQVGAYPQATVQAHLNLRGAEGWELVVMEAHWYWERKGISFAAEITRPRAILGYWCTFKRMTMAK